jgi:hypothetical protein
MIIVPLSTFDALFLLCQYKFCFTMLFKLAAGGPDFLSGPTQQSNYPLSATAYAPVLIKCKFQVPIK